jgi:hypothetical protein
LNSGLTVFQHQVLTALAEGYAARQGMKDRIRALNEWEIARRSGLTQASYAEYLTHPTRDEVSGALSVLQRLGLATVWDRGAKYDTFVPTAAGTELISGTGGGAPAASAAAPSPEYGSGYQTDAAPGWDNEPVLLRPNQFGSQPLVNQAAESPRDRQDAVLERLDEIIGLLRSIDAKLGGR